MHVTCKKCGKRIEVAGKPMGSTTLSGVRIEGNVHVEGGAIGLGPGGSISFGRGGSIGLGHPRPSQFTCLQCGHGDTYLASEIMEN